MKIQLSEQQIANGIIFVRNLICIFTGHFWDLDIVRIIDPELHEIHKDKYPLAGCFAICKRCGIQWWGHRDRTRESYPHIQFLDDDNVKSDDSKKHALRNQCESSSPTFNHLPNK